MYCVSIPIVFACMVGAFVIMLMSFWVEDYVKQEPKWSHLVILPSVIYSLLVYVLNLYYRKLATYLTEWGKSIPIIILRIRNGKVLYAFRKPQNSISI